jgi:hypothetical protein
LFCSLDTYMPASRIIGSPVFFPALFNPTDYGSCLSIFTVVSSPG